MGLKTFVYDLNRYISSWNLVESLEANLKSLGWLISRNTSGFIFWFNFIIIHQSQFWDTIGQTKIFHTSISNSKTPGSIYSFHLKYPVYVLSYNFNHEATEILWLYLSSILNQSSFYFSQCILKYKQTFSIMLSKFWIFFSLLSFTKGCFLIENRVKRFSHNRLIYYCDI